MKNLKLNPDVLVIERQIELERQRLMEVLINDEESIVTVSRQLKKVLILSEQKKRLPSFYISNFDESTRRA